MIPRYLIKSWIACYRTSQIRKAFAKYLVSDPQHAIEHANAAFDEANRAEYEHLPAMV